MIRLALIFAMLCSTLNAATYYVKPTGSNANSGLSESLAWKTMGKACSTLTAGDTVFVRSGTYDENSPTANSPCGETVQRGFVPNNSGTAGNEIVIKGYSGDERPVFLGRNSGGSNPRGMLIFDNTGGNEYIVYDSIHFHRGATGIMLRPFGANHLTFRNLEIDSSYMGCGDDNNAGISMYTSGYEGVDNASNAQRNIIVENCEIYSNGSEEHSSYFALNTSGIQSYCCDSCTFRNNYIHDQFGGIYLKYGARWSEIYGNIIENSVYPMLDMMHGTESSSGSVSYEGLDQVAATRWHHNLAYKVHRCFTLRVLSTSGTYPDSFAYFYNNTCDCDGPYPDGSETSFGAGFQSRYGDFNNVWMFNNIFYNPSQAHHEDCEVNEAGISYGTCSASPVNFYEDYNLYYSDEGVTQFFNTNGTLRTLAQWRAASVSGLTGGAFDAIGNGSSGQQGDHDTIADPLFVDRDARDYRLQAGSPAATGGKGGTLKIFRGYPKEETIDVPTYMGAFAPSGACADTLVAPTFTSPANGATVSLNQVYLDWADSTQVGTVDTYDLQVDDNSDFGSTVFTSATAWSKDTVTTTLKPYGTYYWRVRGRSDCDTSAWSGYRTFVQGDSCIQITGKGSLGSSDTCYCIVDSLVINYANRDTIINTNSKDNIRIWGYHTGGGRAIVRYNLDDAGTLSSHSDSPLISPLFYVSGTDGIKISNIAIVPGTVDDSIWQFTPMSFQTSANIEVSACSTICAGFSSRGMYSPSGTSSYNFWIHDNYFGTISKGYNRRDAMYGTMIHLEGGLKSASGYTQLARIAHNTINTIHTGIGITGGSYYPVVYLDSNTITVDARDDLHMTYDDNDGNNSAGDPYGINIGGCDSLSHIIGNTFAAGSSYYGGDGMILQNVNASKTDRMEVYNNTHVLHHGPHPRIAAGRQAVVGVYARDLVRGLHYHNNLGYLIVDEDTSTHSYGIYGEGARITMTDSGSSYNLIENNHFSIVAKDSASRTGAGTFKVSGLSFIQVDSLIAGHHDVRENLSTNNYWRSPRTPIWGGCTRTQGFNNALISKDTANTIYDGDSTFFSFEQLGTFDGHSIGNALQDMILQGYANLADVFKGTVSSNADSLGKQLSYLRSLTVNLKDVSSANINGGTIWAVDAYGNRHDMPNSNASGNSSDTLRWRFFGYDAMTGDGYVVADSNGYNNFTFWGKSGSDSASTAATINWTTSQSINVQLTDYTPPAPVKTLRGITLKGVTIK